MANIDSLANLTSQNLIDIIMPNKEDDKLLRFFNQMLLYNYNPDINGYTLLFMVPPDLSGLATHQTDPTAVGGARGYEFSSKTYTSLDPSTLLTSLNSVARFATFAAVDFSPPQEQLNTEKISSRSGGIPYATEYTTSEQMSVTYIDDTDLTIYKFHQIWIHYIWDVLEGKLKPSNEYLEPRFDLHEYGREGGLYRGIDYAGAFYVVKYKPDLRKITYIGKCIGVFPQALPSKELIGQRTSNELTTIPFNYFCAAYRAEVVSEIELKTAIQQHPEKYWILKEFVENVLTKFH